MWMTNKGFRDGYFFLSNFFSTPITYEGITYESVESAFQAQKCLDDDIKKTFAPLSPNRAKIQGRRVKLRPDWELVKDDIMEDLIRIKFTEPTLKSQLISTAGVLLVEFNDWNDKYWGKCIRTKQGHNKLGIIIMKIRDEAIADELKSQC